MKKILIPLFAMAALLSCKKANETSVDSSENFEISDIHDIDANNILTCDIDGKSFKSDEVSDYMCNKFQISLDGNVKSDKTAIHLFIDREVAVTGAELKFAFKIGATPNCGISIITKDATGMPIPDKNISMDTGTFTIIKPAPYLNSKLSKNNEIEEVTTSYEADGTTINSQSTSISTHKYNEAGYITKTSFSGGASRTYELEKIN
jgi:hypothetical protein